MSILGRIQRGWIGGAFYRLRPVVRFYHFLFAAVGAFLYRFPSRRIRVVGITGTKGKTTTVELFAAILAASGARVAFVSSASVSIAGRTSKNRLGNSMPGRTYLQRFLRDAVRARCAYAVIEVTSQGVDLFRHRFIRFAAAVFTNLAPEHIEAHGSYEAYRAAKLSFLRTAAAGGATVFLNKGDKESVFFANELTGRRVAWYEKNEASALAVPRALLGAFNRENIAAAAAVARSFNIEEKDIRDGVEGFGGAPGRVEFVRVVPFAAVVDYAHTPDSLEAMYSAIRSDLSPRRLVCVLGAAGGGRDKWKRPAMGKIAADHCDEIVLTNEDPYDEDPEKILDDIAEGFEVSENKKFRNPLSYCKILDRREALAKAVSLAAEGDVVIVTGKGSEMWIHGPKGEKIPWSDRDVLEEIFGEK